MAYYMVCVTCVLIKQLVPARPPNGDRQTSPNGDGLPLVVLRCFAAKNSLGWRSANIFFLLWGRRLCPQDPRPTFMINLRIYNK